MLEIGRISSNLPTWIYICFDYIYRFFNCFNEDIDIKFTL